MESRAEPCSGFGSRYLVPLFHSILYPTILSSLFVTEKTVRPLRSGKPFFSYGPKHFLTRLKALGFKTWDLIWDEDYDNYSSVQRWNKIKQQLDYLYQLDNANFAQIGDQIQNSAGRAFNGITEYFPSDGTNNGSYTMSNFVHHTSLGAIRDRHRGQYLDSTTAATGARIYMSSGNITSGSIHIFGVKK